MKILAFLQNMWVNDPERVKKMIAESEHSERLRRHFIARALFAGCKTGRQLRKELGDLCDTIVWEEASREILGDPKIVPPANLDHMLKVVTEEKPKLVITFGNVAIEGYMAIQRWVRPVPHWISSPHPAARHPACQHSFRDAMREVRSL